MNRAESNEGQNTTSVVAEILPDVQGVAEVLHASFVFAQRLIGSPDIVQGVRSADAIMAASTL
jgi:hypothetical protein